MEFTGSIKGINTNYLTKKFEIVLEINEEKRLAGGYGQPFILENGVEAVIKTNISASQMLENETVHCMPCGSRTEDGKEYIYYKVFRGSSTYDTKEMSILVNGVVSVCQEQGIETMPPAELGRMLEMWKASGSGKE